VKAPIALFAYKRLDHLKKCVEALVKNHFANESELIVFSDGPKQAADRNGVEEVRKYLLTLTGFKSIEIIEQQQNLGLSGSILKGVTDVVNKYGRVIVLEDDLITSAYFLKYMNDSLDRFEANDQVISIHGYIYPVTEKLPDLFFLRGADCWGWATWKRGWDLMEANGQMLLEQIKEKNEIKRFDFNHSYPYTQMLEDQIAGRNNSWAILWYASAFVKHRLTLYPGKSLVHNVGNDNSGTHSLATNRYDVRVYGEEINFDDIDLKFEDNQKVVQSIATYFQRTHTKLGTIKNFINKYLR